MTLTEFILGWTATAASMLAKVLAALVAPSRVPGEET